MVARTWGGVRAHSETTHGRRCIDVNARNSVGIGTSYGVDEGNGCYQVIRFVFSDLVETQSLRSNLEERLSHRAFRETSEPIAVKGIAFASIWKRWFGGYNKFRLELADLYKGDVPTADDLNPTYVAKQVDPSRRQKMQFNSIDEVPDDAIHVAAKFLLTQAGAMTMDDLIKQTSRELGFRRTGPKIRSRIEVRLNVGMESGVFKRSGQRVAIASEDSAAG